MNTGPNLVPPREKPRPQRDIFAFHPVRAAAGAIVGLFCGMVLYAATDHWVWLLLGPASGLLLAFDFWLLLFEDDDPPVFWSDGGDR